jgi:hypothetical protein
MRTKILSRSNCIEEKRNISHRIIPFIGNVRANFPHSSLLCSAVMLLRKKYVISMPLNRSTLPLNARSSLHLQPCSYQHPADLYTTFLLTLLALSHLKLNQQTKITSSNFLKQFCVQNMSNCLKATAIYTNKTTINITVFRFLIYYTEQNWNLLYKHMTDVQNSDLISLSLLLSKVCYYVISSLCVCICLVILIVP